MAPGGGLQKTEEWSKSDRSSWKASWQGQELFHTAQNNINPRSHRSGMERQQAPPHLDVTGGTLD